MERIEKLLIVLVIGAIMTVVLRFAVSEYNGILMGVFFALMICIGFVLSEIRERKKDGKEKTSSDYS